MDALQQAALIRARSALDLAAGGPVRQPGLLASRYLKSRAAGNPREAEAFADAHRYGDVVKAAVTAITSGNSPALLEVGADFMAAVRARSIVARALANMRKLPVNTPSVRQTAGARASWVTEGGAVPLSDGVYTKDAALDLLKVAAITPVSRELARAGTADLLLSRDLVAACAEAIDEAFCDPTNAGLAGNSPASVFYNASAGASAGPGAEGFRADVDELMAAFAGNLDTAALVCDSRTVMQLAALEVGIRFNGREATFAGLPVLYSTAVPRAANGGMLGLVDLDRVTVVGMEEAELAASREASLLMADNPDMSSVTPKAAQLVPMFQTGTIALMGTVYANWRAAPGAACYIGQVDYLSLPVASS